MSRLILALALVTGVAGLGYIVPPEFCKQWEPTGCSPVFESSICSSSNGNAPCDVFASTPEVFKVEFLTETSLITMPPEIVDVSITSEYLFPYAYTSTNGMPNFPITITGDIFTDGPSPVIGYPVYEFTLPGGNLQFVTRAFGDNCAITYACAE